MRDPAQFVFEWVPEDRVARELSTGSEWIARRGAKAYDCLTCGTLIEEGAWSWVPASRRDDLPPRPQVCQYCVALHVDIADPSHQVPELRDLLASHDSDDPRVASPGFGRSRWSAGELSSFPDKWEEPGLKPRVYEGSFGSERPDQPPRSVPPTTGLETGVGGAAQHGPSQPVPTVEPTPVTTSRSYLVAWVGWVVAAILLGIVAALIAR